ncbi:MAG TPA: GNAT family N-acyltransferase [Edaphobacter sp.]|nr:GNAT family N-acyltransferase [Edaphobacter sp.]
MVSVTESPAPVSTPLPANVPDRPLRSGLSLEAGRYVARLAETDNDRRAAYRLRFLVFNLEMNEGLESSYGDGYDRDRYDDVCDHLLVEERTTGAIVGTYRLQMGEVARSNFGYYSEQEFCFRPYEAMRHEIVELGRACIHRDHRSPEVLNLLWRGIARYALAKGGRYMVGCCSLNSTDPKIGRAVYASLQEFLVDPSLRTSPTPAFAMPEKAGEAGVERAPKLLRAYLAIGAKICGEPAIDREFRTIDFLTLIDLQTLHPRIAARFLEGC